MYWGELFARIGIWLAAATLVILWIYAIAEALLPRLSLVLSCFVLSPGGALLVLFLWRILGKKRG